MSYIDTLPEEEKEKYMIKVFETAEKTGRSWIEIAREDELIYSLENPIRRNGMSYITMMGTKHGIIMAADRQAMIAGKNNKVSTRTMKKLFPIGDSIGLSFSGVSGFEEYIEQFCRTYKPVTVEQTAQDFFSFIHEAAMRKVESVQKVEQHSLLSVYMAGYDKNEEFPKPKMYQIVIPANGGKNIFFVGSNGFMYDGCSHYFQPYVDKIGKNPRFHHYTLQDAVDITKLAFNIGINLARYIEFEEKISRDIDMIAITPDGIQWLLKNELEVRYADTEI
jgi:20S proteasome alpha/beta subunit